MKIIVNNLDEEKFEVIIDGKKFCVTLEEEYYHKLTEKKVSKEELIKASFKFLLDRETINQILPEFNLKIIEKYFPNYKKKN